MEERYASGHGAVEQGHTACRVAFRRRRPRMRQSADSAWTTFILIYTARTTAARPGNCIANGIADNAAVNVVREDPVRKGLLFAGTENAVWVSFDDGTNWQSLQLNLPHTSNRDLWIKDTI